jgi:hypothetical protein
VLGLRFVVENVYPRPCNAAVFERTDESVLVDQAPACRVHDADTGVHMSQFPLTDDPFGLRSLRKMHG